MKFLTDTRNSWYTCAIVFLTIAAVPSKHVQSSELMYAVSAIAPQKGILFTVDLETGETQQIGPQGMGLGLEFTTALSARPSDGELFMVDNTDGSLGRLMSVNRNTGLATLIDTQTPIHSLAFGSNDLLYTQMAAATINATGPIGVIDINSGELTSRGGPDLPRLAGLAFDRNDRFLYGITLSPEYKIDQLLKISTDGQLISSVDIRVGTAGAIAFDSTGQLVGSSLSGNLLDIDPATGRRSNYRGTNPRVEIQGLARKIPEPSTVMLIVLCATLTVSMRWRIV